MKRLSLRTLAEIYLLLILLAAAALAALPYSVLALALLVVRLLAMWRQPSPRLEVAFTAATVFLLPLVAEPLSGYLSDSAGLPERAVPILAASSALPVIYLLDRQLVENTPRIAEFAAGRPPGRYLTTTSKALLVSALTMLGVSFLLGSLTILFSAVIFTLYLAGTLAWALLTIPPQPVTVPTRAKRVIAGTTADITLPLSHRGGMRLHNLITPDEPWVEATPQRFSLNGEEIGLKLTITPPLAGPAQPQIRLAALDPRGLLGVNQWLAPLTLEVIPRARYAEWLALRYLEEVGGREIPASGALSARLRQRGGVEYQESRNYHPGDPPKHIDWKHTLKLNKLIIKEFAETGAQTAILAVNLVASDAEEADKIAFQLITTALTLAQEAIPAALAAYTKEQVILTTAALDPREILKETLSLVKNISCAEFTQRLLEPPNLSRLKRDINQLRRANLRTSPTTTQPA